MISTTRWTSIQRAIEAYRWPLYFFGGAGRGKTFAAAQVYAEWPRGGRCGDYGAFWWPAGTVISEIVERRFNGGIGQIQRSVEDACLIVLDDIVDRGMTDARRAALQDLINWRRGQPMIMTGNFSPDELPTITDDRTTSRILAGSALKFGGKDLRIEGLTITEV